MVLRDYKNLVPCVMQTTHFASVSTKIRTVFNGAKSCCRVSIDGQISIRSAHVPQWYNARVVCGNPRFDTGVMHLFFVWPNVSISLLPVRVRVRVRLGLGLGLGLGYCILPTGFHNPDFQG